LVTEAMLHSIDELPAGRTLKILEIGAGTGSTTSQILPRLPARRTEYLFTDVSEVFTQTAKAKFRDFPFVRYGALDIEIDPIQQGYADHHFDMILASNVFHATKDILETVRHTRQLLAPGGSLVLLEGTRPQYWMDLIFGLTEGWWRYTDTDLRPAHPMLSSQQWIDLLSTSGFDQVVALPAPHKAAGSEPQAALEAVHDVMAWNHVYDAVNARPYTALSRFWNTRKFGGFGVWLDDVLYNALLWGHFESERALDNLEAVFAWQTEAGNFPCLVTGNDAWLDRSQPPIAAFVVWSLYLRSGRRELLARAFPALLRNHDWWWARRQLGDSGLIAFGTSPEAGDGLYKGTKLAAKDESTMDNSPLHDPAPFDAASGLLRAADVGINSLVALDGEILARMAATLDEAATAARLAARSAAHKARIAEALWDAERQVFANRLEDGRFIAPIAPTSFYPLAAGIGSEAQAAALIARYLTPERKFGGRFVLPSITRDDPAYGDNVYWRGRIWAPLNYWVYQGLRRAGRDAEARELAAKSWRLFAQGWAERKCGENYNAESGAIDDQPDTDGFYSWGALLPALRVAEHFDATPWSGLTLQAPPPGSRLGPLLTPAGRCFLEADAAEWRLLRDDGAVLLASNLAGRLAEVELAGLDLAGLELAGPAPAVLLPPVARDGGWIAFPAAAATQGTIGDRKAAAQDGRFAVPPGAAPARLWTEC